MIDRLLIVDHPMTPPHTSVTVTFRHQSNKPISVKVIICSVVMSSSSPPFIYAQCKVGWKMANQLVKLYENMRSKLFAIRSRFIHHSPTSVTYRHASVAFAWTATARRRDPFGVYLMTMMRVGAGDMWLANDVPDAGPSMWRAWLMYAVDNVFIKGQNTKK